MRHRSAAPKKPLLPIERFAVPLDENSFVDWLVDAEPGDRVIYYRGHLGFDRMPSANMLDRPTRINLQTVSARVMVTASQDLVIPVQKRLGPEDYLYIAVKALPGRSQSRSALSSRLLPNVFAAPLHQSAAMAA